MATSTITGSIIDGAGAPVAGVTVYARLRPSSGSRLSDGSTITNPAATSTNGSGVYSVVLEQQANITPAGSWWEIEEDIPDAQGGRRVRTISVPNVNATVTQCEVTPAALLGPSALTAAQGDARYMPASGSSDIALFTNTVKIESGTIGLELQAMLRVLGGSPTSFLTTAPKQGIGVKLYNNTTAVGDTGVVYAGVNSTHWGGPAGVNKTWGVVSTCWNQSTTALSTVGIYSTTRNSGGTPTWAAAFEVWDSLDPGSGLVQSNANLVCLELLNLHSGSGTSHGLTVIGGGVNAGSIGIWTQPGNSTNGPAGWSVGYRCEIGPIDVNSVGVQFAKAPTGFPSGTAWKYMQALNASSNEVFSLDSAGVPNITNWTGGSNAGLLKFLRSGSVVAQTGIDTSDRWTSFSSSGTALVTHDSTIADTETALLLRRNVGGSFSQQRVTMGAADSGGAGFKLLRVAN